MYVSTVTISSKGQIVLPKKVRKTLNTNIISLIINDQNQILITPVHELGGSLSSYSKDTDLSYEEVREHSWKNAILAKTDDSADGVQ
jgi:AbrB family looped-hinge helix DNA binding protein